MMTQVKLLELAKQGNPQAIKALIERSLKPTGITVKVALKNQCLMVIAESNNPPDRTFLVDFIRKGILNLDPPSVKRVVVQGHSTGNSSPVWRTWFNLNSDDETATQKQPRKSSGHSTATTLQPQEAIASYDRASFLKTEVLLSEPQTKSNQFKLFLAGIKFLLETLLYIISGVIFVAIAVSFKLGAVLLAEKYFYNIHLIGEFFRGIEIIELLNILVFAIIGMGFGVASYLLPRPFGRYISALLLIILVPIIYSTTYFVRYDSWIQEIAEKDKISYVQAEKITNSYLMNRVRQPGFLGFYIHTAEFPLLPTKQDQMQELAERKHQIAAKFAYVTGVSEEKITALFTISGWGMRVFYFFIAALATVTHFREGLGEAQRLANRKK